MIFIELARERRTEPFVGELDDLENDVPAWRVGHELVADVRKVAGADDGAVQGDVTGGAGVGRLRTRRIDARSREPTVDANGLHDSPYQRVAGLTRRDIVTRFAALATRFAIGVRVSAWKPIVVVF
jgi:hypothetical protein